MSKLIDKVIQKVTADYCRLSIVSNPDGMLSQEQVRTLIYQQTGIEVVTGSQLDLRIHYELDYKQNETGRYIYVCQSTDNLLPDMKREAKVTTFSIADAFPLFADKTLLRRQDLDTLEKLYEQYGNKRVGRTEAEAVVESIRQTLVNQKKQQGEYLRTQLRPESVDWSQQKTAISAVSTVLCEAFRMGAYEEIREQVDEVNERFQEWVDTEYFATLQSNPLLHAKSVNKVLPHLAAKHKKDEKIALLVVDGFSYWQYLILRGHLKGYQIEDDCTLAWLPSITMLSRQALFRGNSPRQDYKQNPENERRLWQEYWKAEGMSEHQIQYIYDTDPMEIREGVTRLAVVTVEMDEKMHASTDYRDLHSLTENWSQRYLSKIQAILDKGYTLYLTTDHGSVLAEGWRTLTQTEKVYLYKDGSRGTRHLIYTDQTEQERFYMDNQDLRMLRHDNWMAIRDNKCIGKTGKTMITHGGSHFMEMVIPLVTIKN